MRRIIGPILALFGIFIVFGLVAGAAYTAGLGAAGVIVPAGTAVAPVVAYSWYGPGFFGFGHFLGFLLVVFLFLGLLRLAFGGGHRGRHSWSPGHGYGPGGPREAWIRGRLDDWHRSAHAADPSSAAGSGSGAPSDPAGSADPSRPSDPPIAG